MEFSYSPHRDVAGGTLHLPSPTHPHNYAIDGFSTINKLRRSMSRSPSKPQRYQLYPSHTPTGSPGSPFAPLGLANRLSPKFPQDHEGPAPPVSPLESHQPATAKKSRFPVRRTTPFRSSSRATKAASNSPMRKALGDVGNQGNSLPSSSCESTSKSEEGENAPRTELRAQSHRLNLNDGPIKFEFSRSLQENNAPAKSSPLKRGDGLLNLDQGSFGSPVAKRRSLHGPLSGADLDMLKYAMNSDGAGDERDPDGDTDAPAQPTPMNRNSPLRKSLSLRKSTIQQRHTPSQPKSHGPEFALPTVAASKNRNRFSLDGSLPFESPSSQSPFRRSSGTAGSPLFSHHKAIPHRPSPASKQPHPLANTLSPSSSASSLGEESRLHSKTPFRQPTRQTSSRHHPQGFSKSLPLGATRPALQRSHGGLLHQGQGAAEDPSLFSTPEAYKMAKPLPAAFMSTGLISKKNRNAELPPSETAVNYVMPDTPSKRVSFPPMTATPFRKSTVGNLGGDVQFGAGSPSSPFGSHARKDSGETFGNSVSIFGSRMKASTLNRKGSFASLTGDDEAHSPSHLVESQSSNDEFPPTPTKPNEGRRSKENSLRSSLFGRRTSLNPDTFVPPSSATDDAPVFGRKTTPTAEQQLQQTSPHTPQDSVNPPDPSGLSISGKAQGQNLFKLSTSSNIGFPPATPTAPREYQLTFPDAKPGPVAGVFNNDIDTALTARFGTVVLYGTGEFSQVYRVEHPHHPLPNASGSSFNNFGKVWAVKRTKRPFIGTKDKERKLQEVKILQTLRGHDHIVQLSDSWEAEGHLYIQTEFCENGNLKDFLTQTGFKARLDDFRIWKILLELSLGLKHIHDHSFIHLDLKPANVFIDWEGALKIGDFGLASPWPAPPNIDGEGDREYIAPEVLHGRVDKPADVFALGMIMLEIAGNIILPDYGTSWQRLRAGDLSDLPSLTWSESSLARDESGEPIDGVPNRSHETLCGSDSEEGTFKFRREASPTPRRKEELVVPPGFMADAEHPEALDKVVQGMICPEPDERLVVDQLCQLGPVLWVEKRRRAGATVYEGNYGPADDVLNHDRDVDMVDAD